MSRRNHKKNTIVGGDKSNIAIYKKYIDNIKKLVSNGDLELALDSLNIILGYKPKEDGSNFNLPTGDSVLDQPTILDTLTGAKEYKNSVNIKTLFEEQKRIIEGMLEKNKPNNPVDESPTTSIGDPIGDPNVVSQVNVNSDSVNPPTSETMINNDNARHGVTLTLVSKADGKGVKLLATFDKTSQADTQAVFNNDNAVVLSTRNDITNEVRKTDSAIGDLLNLLIDDNKYKTNYTTRRDGFPPSGMEMLKLLMRHDLIDKPEYEPIITGVLLDYNNVDPSVYDDTNWIRYGPAEEAYNTLILNNRKFLLKERAYSAFGRKRDMGIINRLETTKNAIGDKLKSTKNAFSNLLNSSEPVLPLFTQLKRLLGLLREYIRANSIDVKAVMESLTRRVADPVASTDSDSDGSIPEPVNTELFDNVINIFNRLITAMFPSYTNAKPISATDDAHVENVDDVTQHKKENLLSFLLNFVQRTLDGTILNGLKNVFVSSDAVINEPVFMTVWDFSNMTQEQKNTIVNSDLYRRALRRQTACDAIMRFVANNLVNLKKQPEMIFALLNLWTSINWGNDTVIKWTCLNNCDLKTINIDVGTDDEGKQFIKANLNPGAVLQESERITEACKRLRIENPLPKFATGSSSILDIITQNLKSMQVLEDGTPRWPYTIIKANQKGYKGKSGDFIMDIMRRRGSGYVQMGRDTLGNVYNNVTKKLNINEGYGRLKDGLKDSFGSIRDRIFGTQKKQPVNNNDESDDTVRGANITRRGGNKNHKHSKRVAKNKKNKRKTRRH